MKSPSNIPEALRKLFSRSRESDEPVQSVWLDWLNDPTVQEGRLTLVRAGEDSFVTQVLNARLDANNLLFLVVDRLLPSPDYGENETVLFHGKLQHMDAGVEVTTTFIAKLGEPVLHEGDEALELHEIDNLDVESREYVAAFGDAHGVALSLFWQGEWVTVWPEQGTITRFMFDARLDGTIGIDGVAVPKSTVSLGDDSPESPIQLQLIRRPSPSFEVLIEKIDGPLKAKLASIIEEIWRIERGLQAPTGPSSKSLVGYMDINETSMDEALEIQILLLASGENARIRFVSIGKVRQYSGREPKQVVEDVLNQRTDIIIGDSHHWGPDAVQVERLLRAHSKTRFLPRFWLGDPYKDPENGLDILDYGAFGTFNDQTPQTEIEECLHWSIGKSNLEAGLPKVAFLSADPRIKYRLGLAIMDSGFDPLTVTSDEAVLAEVEEMRPDWIVLDKDGFPAFFETVLEALIHRSKFQRHKIILLCRSARRGELIEWLKMGVKDIILLDASLRNASKRMHQRLTMEKE